MTFDPGRWHRFQEGVESLAAMWDVWFAMQAGARYIERIAQQRLAGLIAFARQHSPFYRDLYRGIPQDACVLAQLPAVRKRDLMAQFDSVVTDRKITAERVRAFVADEARAGQPFLGRYTVWTSSGSTGEPGLYVHDTNALAVYDALQTVRFRRLVSPALFAGALLANDRYALIGATGGHFAGNATFQRLRSAHPWLRERLRIFSILGPIATLTRALDAYQPTLLATYPTAASLLADEQRSGRLKIRPRQIWTGGESLSSSQREHIQSTFQCVVRDDYGASEFMAIASECENGVFHVNSDWVILEPVDEHDRVLPPGVPSHTVLLTNLANRVQPLIRYDLGDTVTLLEGPCECGSPLPALRLEGRCDDVIELSDAGAQRVKLLPLALVTVVEDEADLFRFQLVQKDLTHLLLRLDPLEARADKVAQAQQALRHFLDMHELRNVELAIEQSSLCQHVVSGKLRRVLGMH